MHALLTPADKTFHTTDDTSYQHRMDQAIIAVDNPQLVMRLLANAIPKISNYDYER